MMKKVLLIFGTRPEAIKLFPLLRVIRRQAGVDVRVCSTGQHKELLAQVLDTFGVRCDFEFSSMKENQSLAEITSGILTGMDTVLQDFNPDIAVVQGDTTTAMASALACFYRQIPVAHVEAGLRTYNIYSPWPEEINRQIIGRIAVLNFAPTKQAEKNLLGENVPAPTIHVTGNTVVDAMNIATELIDNDSQKIFNEMDSILPGILNDRIVLITGHRRENFGQDLESVCKAVLCLAGKFPDVHFVYPVHLNPKVKVPVYKLLGNPGIKNIHLIEPLGYLQFIWLMKRSALVLSDSGGIQEEAPGLGKMIFITRKLTERTEGIDNGFAQLVGTDQDIIIERMTRFLNGKSGQCPPGTENPYGDGKASARIAEILLSYLEGKTGR